MINKVNESKLSGPTSKPNPEYKKIHSKISNLRQYFSPNYRYKRSLTKEEEKIRLSNILNLEKKRALLKSSIPSTGYRIYYVRYADDFLIGVNGPKSYAEKLKLEIKDFLKNQLQLDLNMEKTKITDATKGAHFLGSILRSMTSRTNDQPRRSNNNKVGRKIRARIPQSGIKAFAPLEKIVKKLESQGMCRIVDFRNRIVIPTRKTS